MDNGDGRRAFPSRNGQRGGDCRLECKRLLLARSRPSPKSSTWSATAWADREASRDGPADRGE